MVRWVWVVSAGVVAAVGVSMMVSRLRNVRGDRLFLAPVPTADLSQSMKGRRFVVTGANAGIGAEMTKGLAAMGADVVMACRSLERGRAAWEKIEPEAAALAERHGHQLGRVTVMQLDLSSFRSIENFVTELRGTAEDGKVLDVLINNAGLSFNNHRETQDGLRQIMGVNHFGPFYLTRLLLDDMLPYAHTHPDWDARIVFVASGAHKYGRFNPNDIDFKSHGTSSLEMGLEYATSKLANILTVQSLGARLKDTPIRVNAVHPGFIQTEIARDAHGLVPFLFSCMTYTIGMGAWQGAQNTLYMATSPRGREYQGGFFVQFNLTKPNFKFPEDPDVMRDTLWNESCKVVDKLSDGYSYERCMNLPL